jgi:phosphopantothenoylcysteine decarboxylase/phosphopantothenate--cysteine ligase
MGYDIADCVASLGAEVVLVSGPSHLQTKNKSVLVKRVTSADEMYAACHEVFDTVDVMIAAAAVADYKPKTVAENKIKKTDENFSIELEKTKDILSSLGAIKKQQFLIGFALETENETEHAIAKIKKKNLDLIVLNSLRDVGAGFGLATNKVTFIDKNFTIMQNELKSKEAVAQDIIDLIIKHYEKDSI